MKLKDVYFGGLMDDSAVKFVATEKNQELRSSAVSWRVALGFWFRVWGWMDILMHGHSQFGSFPLLSGVLRTVRSATGPLVKSTTLRVFGSQRVRGRRPFSIMPTTTPTPTSSHNDDTKEAWSIVGIF